MKKLALGVLFAGLAACGGGKKVDIIDTPPPDDVGVCNPLAQTGCAAGEKCSWIIDDAVADIGHIGCAPDGAVPVDGACMNPGGIGADDCVKGTVCVAAECKAICDPMAAAAASGCDAQHSCSRYSGLFEQADMILFGACDPAADPLTQRLLAGDGNLEACGSPNAALPTKGAYTFDFETFSCAPVSDATRVLTDQAAPSTDGQGRPFVNGCAPGWMPFFFESTGSMKTLCSGLCAPVKTDNTLPDGVTGDKTVLAKLPTEAAPAAGNAVCTTGKKGLAPPNDENCLFLWFFLRDNAGNLSTSQYNDTLGVCFNYQKFTFDATTATPDANQDYPVAGSATEAFPSCAKLVPKGTPSVTTGDSLHFGNAADWACVPSAERNFVAGSKRQVKVNPAAKNFRLGYGPGVAFRPTVVTK